MRIFFTLLITIIIQSSPVHARCLQYGDIIHIGKQISGVGNKYLAAEPNGSAQFNRTQLGTWEHFQVVNSQYPGLVGNVFEGDKIALLSVHDKFLVAEQNGTINANRPQIGPWEAWEINQQHPVTPPNTLIDQNKCINLSGGSPLGANQGFFSLRSHLGTYLNTNAAGNVSLSNTPVRLFTRAGNNYSHLFNISQHMKNIDFIQDCDLKTVPSKYGPLEICVFQPNELLVLNLTGIAGADGYHIELHEFKPEIWKDVPTYDWLNNTGSAPLYPPQWVCSQCNIPKTLIINDYAPMFFGQTLQTNTAGSHDGKIYHFRIATGPYWKSVDVFFDIQHH